MAEAKKSKKVEDGVIEEDSKSANQTDQQAEVTNEVTAQTTNSQDSAEAQEEKVEEATKTAKAGKRSAKAIHEAEEKQAKEERKAEAKEHEGDKPASKPAPKTRSRLERQGKNFREAAKLVEKDKEYTLAEALDLAIKTSKVKFDATVEMHIRLGVDPRHADQNIRENLVLPAGTGKTVRIAVFAEADDAEKAKKAGADIAGTDEITKALDKGQIAFDTLISTPAMMAKLGKYARVLGPRGLMPNPKSGTVTPDVAKAVKEAKAGRVEYRVDSTGIVHIGVGKVSFGKDKLTENVKAVVTSVKGAKPASVKGNYFKSVFVTTTMGPSMRVALSEVQ